MKFYIIKKKRLRMESCQLEIILNKICYCIIVLSLFQQYTICYENRTVSRRHSILFQRPAIIGKHSSQFFYRVMYTNMPSMCPIFGLPFVGGGGGGGRLTQKERSVLSPKSPLIFLFLLLLSASCHSPLMALHCLCQPCG